MNSAKLFKHKLIQAMVSILVTQTALMPVSFALKIQIRSDVKIRDNIDNSMERIGLLKRGSIVEIPNEFVVSKNGRPDLELTLNNWLRNAGQVRKTGKSASAKAGLYSFDGENRDYFFPVQITRPADGSTLNKGHQDSQHFIALKYLARKGNAIIVSDDVVLKKSDVVKKETAPRPRPKIDVQHATPVDHDAQMEASVPCGSGPCIKPSQVSSPLHKLVDAISPALASVDKNTKAMANRTRQDIERVESNFRKSCGIALNDFIPVLQKRADDAGVPAQFLLALMTQESGGRCFVLNSETDRTQSVGLFQINTASSKIKRCTAAQKDILRSMTSIETMEKNGPRCLENPLVNLDESIRITHESVKILSAGKDGFDFDKLSSEDQLRVTASAYNGGPSWVRKAKADLESFNQKNGTNLNAHNWEDLRLFYMRSWLERGERAEMLGATNGGRSRKNAVMNLAYAENIVGRDRDVAKFPSLTRTWLAALNE